MGRITVSEDTLELTRAIRRRRTGDIEAKDRLTRSRDRLPKQRLNTRRKLAVKRAEDRVEFQKGIEVRRRRSKGYRGSQAV